MREKHEDEVAEGGAERARRTPAGRRRRAGIKGRRGGGGWQLHRGFDRRTAKGDEDFVQGSAFSLGRRGRDCPLL